MVLLWYGGTGTSIGNLSYTGDANKNKTSETICGTMSGYGFTSRSRAINFRSRIAQTIDASTPCAKSSIAHEFSLDTSLHLTTDTLPLSDASYIDEPVVRKTAGTSGTIHYYHRIQQYSITAMTTSTGAVAERYAYTAYGQPTIASASGSVLTSSAIGNWYTYTGREWDETLGLHHFRARWMSPLAGRFLGRDPIGFGGSQWNLGELLLSNPMNAVDPAGLACTKISIIVGPQLISWLSGTVVIKGDVCHDVNYECDTNTGKFTNNMRSEASLTFTPTSVTNIWHYLPAATVRYDFESKTDCSKEEIVCREGDCNYFEQNGEVVRCKTTWKLLLRMGYISLGTGGFKGQKWELQIAEGVFEESPRCCEDLAPQLDWYHPIHGDPPWPLPPKRPRPKPEPPDIFSHDDFVNPLW